MYYIEMLIQMIINAHLTFRDQYFVSWDPDLSFLLLYRHHQTGEAVMVCIPPRKRMIEVASDCVPNHTMPSVVKFPLEVDSISDSPDRLGQPQSKTPVANSASQKLGDSEEFWNRGVEGSIDRHGSLLGTNPSPGSDCCLRGEVCVDSCLSVNRTVRSCR